MIIPPSWRWYSWLLIPACFILFFAYTYREPLQSYRFTASRPPLSNDAAKFYHPFPSGLNPTSISDGSAQPLATHIVNVPSSILAAEPSPAPEPTSTKQDETPQEPLPAPEPTQSLQDSDFPLSLPADHPTADATPIPTVSLPASPDLPIESKIPSDAPFAFSAEEAKSLPACAEISTQHFTDLQHAQETSVHTFFQGEILKRADILPASSTICIIVAVPQKPPPQELYQEAPLPGKWPDTIHLFLSSSSIRFSIPPLRALPSQPNAHDLFSEKAILYYAEFELNHEGVYRIQAEHEHPNWYWAKHGWAEASAALRATYHETLERMNKMSNLAKFTGAKAVGAALKKYPIKVRTQRMFPAEITVATSLEETELPFCYNQRHIPIDTHKGRWYHQQTFPKLAEETADEFGYSFDLDKCRLDYFGDRDMIDCLANKVIHFYGDSNGRRLCRSLLSGGRWCHDTQDKCQQDDLGIPATKVVLNSKGDIVEEVEGKSHGLQFEIGDKLPYIFGNNSSLYYGFFTSMAYDPKHWLARFYNKNEYKLPRKKTKKQQDKTGVSFFNSSDIFPGAHAHQPFSNEKPDLVVVSMSTWDDALDGKYTAFENTIPSYRDTLMEAYPDEDITMILRLSQGYCCRKKPPPGWKRWSGTRIQHFGDISREAFKVDGGTAMGGRMSVLDASALTGRPEVVAKYNEGALSTNHQRADEVRTQVQILLNQVCGRDATGKAIWKPK